MGGGDRVISALVKDASEYTFFTAVKYITDNGAVWTTAHYIR